MTDDFQELRLQWLKTGTDAQRRHALQWFQKTKPMEYPSLLRQAANAAQAVGSVVASAVRGEPVSVPQEEQDRRLALCHACEFWDSKQGRCSKCGCFGAWKTWLTSQRCPIGKW
jgi:hypothetical protein